MITNNYPDADCLFDLDGLIDDNNYNYKNTIKKPQIIHHQLSEDVDESDYDDGNYYFSLLKLIIFSFNYY